MNNQRWFLVSVLAIGAIAAIAYHYRVQLVIYIVQSCVFLLAQVEQFYPSDSLTLSPKARAFNRLLRLLPSPGSLEEYRAYQQPIPLLVDSALYRVDSVFNRSLIVRDITASCLNTQNKTAILYLHGGGFVFGSASIQANLVFPVISDTIHSLENSQHTCLDVLFLEYGLCPEYRLEQVLEQVHKGYKYLESIDEYSHISIMGDSAGGSLSLLLISEKLQPISDHPKLDSVVPISPCLDLTMSTNSWKFNKHSDVLVTDTLGKLMAEHVTYGDIERATRFSVLQRIKQDPSIVLPRMFLAYSASERFADENSDFANIVLQMKKTPGAVVREKHGLPHIFPLFSFVVPESRSIMEEIISFVIAIPKKTE